MRHVAHRPWSCAPEKKVSIKIINKALVFISFWVAHFRDANGWLPACLLLLLVCCCWLERWFVCTVCLSILDRLSKAIRLNLLRLLLLRFLSTRGRYILECSTFASLFSTIYHIILRMHSPRPPQMVTRATLFKQHHTTQVQLTNKPLNVIAFHIPFYADILCDPDFHSDRSIVISIVG